MKQVLIFGAAGIGLLSGGWTLLAQMQGAGRSLQGGGGFMQGGAMQGVPPAGSSASDQPARQGANEAAPADFSASAPATSGSMSPQPPAFAIPGEGPVWVSEIHGGEGAIRPYTPPVSTDAGSGTQTGGVGIMQITNPSGLATFLSGQPGVNAELNLTSAVQVQDATGATYSPVAGQLQSLLRFMASPNSGYTGTIDLSLLSPNAQQRLLASGTLTAAPQQTDASAGGAGGGQGADQLGNQSQSPGGGLEQQGQGPGIEGGSSSGSQGSKGSMEQKAGSS